MGMEERRLSASSGHRERRGRGHHGGRHPEARDQEQPEWTFNGGRPSIDLTQDERHRRAELRVSAMSEEALPRHVSLTAAREEATQPGLPISDFAEHSRCVRADVARLVHVQRGVLDRRDPPVVHVALLRIAELACQIEPHPPARRG